MQNEKKVLRQIFRMKRSALDKRLCFSGSAVICRVLREVIKERNIRSIMVYLNMPEEPNLKELIDYALSSNISVYIPRCTDQIGIMNAHRFFDWNELEKGAFGILMPKETNPTALPEDIDCILVPGVLYDEKGGRLGMGGGYYDRFLAKVSPQKTIGICWDFQVQKEGVPMDDYDISVGEIITEKRRVKIIS